MHNLEYYISLFNKEHIDKEYIYELTAKINNCLHFEFGIKNLYHRMIFTACALVAKRYDALMVKGMDYSEFHNAILNCLNKELITFTDTAAKSTDSFFYQERDFIGYPHVQGMYAKTHEWTKNEGLFLNSVIKSLLKGQYDFIRKMTRAEMLKLKVRLPAVINNGEWIPDWSYMENYMQSTIEVAEKMMNDFEKLSI